MQPMLQPCTWPGRNFVAQLHLVALPSEGRRWPWEGTRLVGTVGVRQAYLITALLLRVDVCISVHITVDLYSNTYIKGAEELK